MGIVRASDDLCNNASIGPHAIREIRLFVDLSTRI